MRADNDLLATCNELDEARNVFTGIAVAVAITLISGLCGLWLAGGMA